ncbi:hypothetical protein ACFQPF_11930 [Fictibacillus iocasae]|uniref:KTSC domain-containing protein n=1 Tax=Fictibacillus iocasae TaxID=2715437 RepID=A0ABW2NWH1_9BACL
MIRNDEKDQYISFTGRHFVKLYYKGENMCELYIDHEYKGLAPFLYTVRKLRQLERSWLLAMKNVQPYHFKEIKPFIDISI